MTKPGQTRLFLSYARDDQAAARRVRELLRKSGFRIFMDETEILAGEQFVVRLHNELARSDGVIFLHTAHSTVSEWCHAEIYAAISLRLQVLRIKTSDAGPLPDPMERLLSSVHYLQWQGPDPPPLDEHLNRAREHARARLVRRVALAVSLLLAVIALVALFFMQWDSWQTQQRRAAIIRSIESSQATWSTRQVAGLVAGLQRDTALLGTVRTLQDDPTVTNNAARFNAWQVSQYLAHELERGKRWDLSGIRWQDGALKQPGLSDVTVRNGAVENLTAEDCKLAGVYFGPSPGLRQGEPGLSFVNAHFTRCEFWNVWFDSTQLLSVEFHDSKFRGVQLGLEGMSAVRFTGTPAEGPVITGEMALFEDSVIYGLPHGPEKGVLDLSEPEKEVIFDSVDFVRVRFSGWFRPEWFRNSHFRDCTFPPSFPSARLTVGKNQIDSPDL